MAKVGINGFGRIGRLVLRTIMEKSSNKCAVPPLTQVVCINDPYLSAAHMAYLFTYDSNYGKYPGHVATMGKCILVDGQRIETFGEKRTDKIPWDKNCVDYVVDSSGVNDTMNLASAHLKGGVKRVIVTSFSKDIPMFVVGVNHECYNNDMKVISCSTCTINALTTLAKVLHDNYHIEYGLMTAIHSVTSAQRPTDMGTKTIRLGRNALQNIIPVPTNAITALSKILPDLKGKISGLELRVPVPIVSLLDLSLKLCEEVPIEQMKCKLKRASDSYMKGIMGYTEDPVTSTDLIGDPRSCVLDAGATIPLSNSFLKLFAWYDNEYAYACRVGEMINYIHSREEQSS